MNEGKDSQKIIEKLTAELMIANKKLLFHQAEKSDRGDELEIANKELLFQNDEKEKRADELEIANKELLYQQAEKANRAEELNVENKRFEFSEKVGNVGTWEYVIEKDEFWASAQSRSIYGSQNEDSIFTLELVESCIPEKERVHQALVALLEKNTVYNIEFEINPLDGSSTKTIASLGEVIRDESGVAVKVIGSIKDITERASILKELEESENRYRGLVDNLSAGVIVHSADTSIIFNNEKACELLGLSDDMLKGKKAYDPAWKFVKENMETLSIEDYPVNLVISTRKPFKNLVLGIINPVFSEIVWCSVNGTPYIDKYGEIKEVIVSFYNITETVKKQSKIEESERKYRLLTNTMPLGMIHYQIVPYADRRTEFKIIGVNNNYEQLVGMKSSELVGKNLWDVFPETEQYWIDEFEEVASSGKMRLFENYSTVLDMYVKIHVYKIKEDEIASIVEDVTEDRKNREEIIYLGYHDSLTGLHSRRYYNDHLIKLDIPENYPLTIVMSDINGLKLINDGFGHLAGDKFITSAATTISKFCRKTDLVARIGGDEFIIVMPNTNGIEAEKIIDEINNETKNITIESVELSISFGFKTKNRVNEDIEEIFKSAEDMMYRVKLNELHSMRSRTIETILTTLYEKDKGSEMHSRTVSEISEKFATVYGMDKQEVAEVKTAGLLHDIGKIVIPISIITKEGKLTAEEYDLVKGHPEMGFRILSSTHDMRNISNIILNHHERWDGFGYPRGIKAEEIPLQSRMISIADAFEAMTSERTYKEILSNEDALNEIQNNAGSQFDPELVQVFVDNFDMLTEVK